MVSQLSVLPENTSWVLRLTFTPVLSSEVRVCLAEICTGVEGHAVVRVGGAGQGALVGGFGPAALELPVADGLVN